MFLFLLLLLYKFEFIEGNGRLNYYILFSNFFLFFNTICFCLKSFHLIPSIYYLDFYLNIFFLLRFLIFNAKLKK